MGPTAEAPESRRLVETLRKGIPEQILGHYDRLRARGKKGVALVRHGVCNGCQMKLASGPYAALIRDDDIAMCDTCGRYLLRAPEAAPAPEAPPAPAPEAKKPAPRKRRSKTAADAPA